MTANERKWFEIETLLLGGSLGLCLVLALGVPGLFLMLAVWAWIGWRTS